jgi:hypothetical protein
LHSVLPRKAATLEDVYELEPHEVALQLVSTLARPLVAAAMGVKETKLVAQWERAEKAPRENRDRALRVALQLTLLLTPRYSSRTIQSWFVGVNRHLADKAPSEVLAELAHTSDHDAERGLLTAARAFVNR